MKNLLTQWETEEENRKISGDMPLIDSKHNGNMLLINRKLVELENDAEYASFPKLIKLVKKPFNLIKTGKEESHYPISYFLTCLVELVRQLYFCFAEGLMGLTDGLAIGKTELRGEEVAVGFSK